MKKISAFLLASALIFPVFAHAQATDPSQMSNDQIRATLIVLMQKVVELEQELMALEAAIPSQGTVDPTVVQQTQISPSMQENPTPQNGAVAPTPAPQQAQTPQPSFSIRIIAWPGPVSSVTRTFKASSTLQSADQDTTDDSHVNLGAIVIDANGKPVGDAQVSVTATDPSQSSTMNGSGNAYGNPATPYYPFSYVFKTMGTHTVIFSANGISKAIELTAN